MALSANAAPRDPDGVYSHNGTTWTVVDGAQTADETACATDGSTVTTCARIARAPESKMLVRIEYNDGLAGLATGDTVTVNCQQIRNSGDLVLLPYDSGSGVNSANNIAVAPILGDNVFTLTQSFIDDLFDQGGGAFAMRFTAIDASQVFIDRCEVTEIGSDLSSGGTCPTVTTTADSSGGSLRQCITYANSNPGTTISFDIPDTAPGYTISGSESWWRISPISTLPTITAPGTIIDGTTQAVNYGSDTNSLGPEIEVNGVGAGAGVDGMSFSAAADSSQVRGLMLTRFTGDGIHIVNGANGITVADNWIGTDGSGAAAMGNNDDGVEILGAGSIIDSNVIVNSGDEGINLTGAGATGNTIIGNIIGLEPDGSSGAGNADVGIAILTGAAGNTIGGLTAAERNIISMNFEGIEVNTANNVITGNYIGTDATGTLPRGNRSDDGIEIQNGNDNTIGGTTAGAGNLIAYNQLRGVTIKAGTGTQILGNNIHSNNSMGIDLSNNGVTANNGTTGALPNIGMDYPVLTVSMLSGTDLHVEGYVGTSALMIAGTHIVELFKADDDGDSNGEIESGDGLNVGHGEGRWFIDRCLSAADGTFNCDLTVPGSVSLAVADSLTATATETANNTSEFGANFVVGANQALVKEARLMDGTLLGPSTTLAAGTRFYFVIYVDNPTGLALTDSRIVDTVATGATNFTVDDTTFEVLNVAGPGIDMNAANDSAWAGAVSWLGLAWDAQTIVDGDDYLDWNVTTANTLTIGQAANAQLDVPVSGEADPVADPRRVAYRFQVILNP